MTPTEGLAAAEGDGNHDEDDEGAEVGRQVGLHRLFDHVAEGEHTHHAEGEQQLDGQDAEHLHGEIHHWILRPLRRVLTQGWEVHISQISDLQTFLTNPLLTVLSSNEDEDMSGVVSDGASGQMSLKDSYPPMGS